MFGEMIGAALADCWKRAGAPADADLCRAWPGRGTLAADALRVLRSAGFAGEVHLVETSPVLRELSAQAVPRSALARSDRRASRSGRCSSSPTNSSTHCRSASTSAGIERRRGCSRGRARLRPRRRDRRDFARARRSGRAIAAHADRAWRCRLLIDYGHERTAPGDTLQAVRGHRFAPVLRDPGRAGPDLPRRLRSRRRRRAERRRNSSPRSSARANGFESSASRPALRRCPRQSRSAWRSSTQRLRV